MSSDRLTNFLYLYQKWTSVVVTKAILIGFMIIIASVIGIVSLVDETKYREIMERAISILMLLMVFLGGMGFTIFIIIPMKFNKLQEKV